MILSIYLQNKEQLFVAFVFIAPNLVYLHNLDINKSVNGTSVPFHLSHFSSLCDTHIKGSK